MTAPFKLREVAPIDAETKPAFVCHADRGKSGLRMVTTPVYPANPKAEAFRLTRIGVRLRTPEDGPAPEPTPAERATGLQRNPDWIDIAPTVGLRAAAAALGMSPTDLSGLETGRLDFVDPEDWDRATAAIIAARRPE